MEEIVLKNNKTGLKVFINGVPRLENIHTDDLSPVVVNLERAISEHYENYQKRRKYTGNKSDVMILGQ